MFGPMPILFPYPVVRVIPTAITSNDELQILLSTTEHTLVILISEIPPTFQYHQFRTSGHKTYSFRPGSRGGFVKILDPYCNNN